MKSIKDGFHIIAGYNCIVEDGYIARVCTDTEKGCWGVPFIPCKYGGWDNAYKQLTPDAFRARLSRGTVIIA